ncbi:MAG: hypothetical protein JW838_02105 [Spirochaetes bacterium]|nr:hypothetical protein [Spirochaetota bacterium]
MGRRLGISDEEMEKLAILDRDSFDFREWLVLKTARGFVDAGGRMGEWDHLNDYRRHYTEKERAYHLKLFRMMRFANLFNNTLDGRQWHNDEPAYGAACPIDLGGKSAGDGSP